MALVLTLSSHEQLHAAVMLHLVLLRRQICIVKPWEVKYRSYASPCSSAEANLYCSAEEAVAAFSVAVNNFFPSRYLDWLQNLDMLLLTMVKTLSWPSATTTTAK